MINVKCADCKEYRNEWCEKVVDSPHPDLLRDCQYWHKRRDMVEVIRCKECSGFHQKYSWCDRLGVEMQPEDYCSYARRRAI